MRLNSVRMMLEPFTMADIELFHATNTSAFVRRYLWDDEVIDKEVSRQILEEMEDCFADRGWGLWKLLAKDSGEYIGYAGLWRFFGEQQPQLVYAIHERFTGQGYATEAAQSVVDYAFEKLMFSYLLAATDTDNTASADVCKRLGFRLLEQRIINDKPTLFYRRDAD